MKSILDNVSSRLRHQLRGLVALAVVDGQGGLVAPAMEWRSVQRWAQGRSSTGIIAKDLQLIVERLQTCVVRPGTTFAQTTGTAKSLFELRRDMASAGFEVKEWEFPRNLDELMAQITGQPKDQDNGSEKADSDGDESDKPGTMPGPDTATPRPD
jgi:hypothetical protein